MRRSQIFFNGFRNLRYLSIVAHTAIYRYPIILFAVLLAFVIVPTFIVFSTLTGSSDAIDGGGGFFTVRREKIPDLWTSIPTLNLTNNTFATGGSLPATNSNPQNFAWSISRDSTLSNLSLLRDHIIRLNGRQFVHNTDLFGQYPLNFILIVQIHDRFMHLLYLIESLRNVRGIEEALVVFSHDVFAPEVNKMIGGIRFVRYIQIFFPYSMQLFPSAFPGHDARDCKIRWERGCLNQEWPDVAGNFRDPHFTQIKHHWLWKLRFVVKKLQAARGFSGFYVLLEEDYFVMKDALHVLNLTRSLNKTYDLIVLGSYERSQSYYSPQEVSEGDWSSTKQNMGMSFKEPLLQKLEPAWKNFCLYDDYNWDWTLAHVVKEVLHEKLRVLHFGKAGRVFHVGSCGVHSKGNDCDNVEAVIAQQLERAAQGGAGERLFPKALQPRPSYASFPRSRPKNGGWGDARDHALCLAMLADRWQSISQLILSEALEGRNVEVFEPLILGVSLPGTAVL